LFDAAAESLRDVGSATRALKECRLGYFGVLHTWGRDPLVYHPHVHFVVPGGIYGDVPESAWMKNSVVDIQPVGNGQAVLKYLAPYVYGPIVR
jgi:hypothetical protein